MNKIVTFGEIMMRLNPNGNLRFVQADEFKISYAGAEANVAASLSNFGMDTSFVTKLPNNEIGQSVKNYLRRFGVGVQDIVLSNSRLGIFYVEKGASQRPSKVIYDRENSAIALAKKKDFDWNTIFEDAKWFHFTGITPALGGQLPEICLDALTVGKEKGLYISCDMNYRKKLWSIEQASSVMRKLMTYVDLWIGSVQDAKDLFGICPSDINENEITKDNLIDVAKQLTNIFGFKHVAITSRTQTTADYTDWSGMLYNSGKANLSPTYHINIVDRIGGGDGFSSGLIYSLMNGFDSQSAVDFAVASSCLKHTIEYDFNLVSVPEVDALIKGNVSGRVLR